MSIKIHHGPPGSYKTAGAIADDVIRAAKDGRVVITNVRGMSYDKFADVFDDLPASFDLVHVDTSTEEGKERMRRWFQWAPHGAFLHIDEVQDIFPRRWRDSDLAAFNWPGGADAAKEAGRPVNWEMAWDMHRHYNWDVVLTTPSIAKVRDDIRGASEGAFKHKNLGLLGFGGRYMEAFHAAEDSGKYEKDFISVSSPKKIPSEVWRLYDSTSTGVVTDTKAGLSLFANPRLLFLLLVVAGGLFFAFRNGLPENPVGGGASVASANPDVRVEDSKVPAPTAAGVRGDHGRAVPVSQVPASAIETPFNSLEVYIIGSLQRSGGNVRYVFSAGGVELTHDDILAAGYSIFQRGLCAAELFHIRTKTRRFVMCGSADFYRRPSPSAR